MGTTNVEQKPIGTHQQAPLFEFLEDDGRALGNPVVEDGADAQGEPADVEPARGRVQLVDLRVAHPHRHEAAADEHCNTKSHVTARQRKEGNVLFNDALNTFYLRLYGVRHMVKNHSDSKRGNPLLPHRLLFLIRSKGSLICTIPDRIAHTMTFVTPVVEHWLEREIAQLVHPMKDRSDDPSHHERTLLPRNYISLLQKFIKEDRKICIVHVRSLVTVIP